MNEDANITTENSVRKEVSVQRFRFGCLIAKLTATQAIVAWYAAKYNKLP
jgi:hypothetical protein